MLTTRRTFLKTLGGAATAGTAMGTAPLHAQTGPVKIGVLGAKAGVWAPVGESGFRGTQYAVDKINAAGGILGRKVETVMEEESSPQETVERFRKLALQTKVDVITGTASTAVGLAIGPVAEDLKMIWLSWDATTQKGVEETMPSPSTPSARATTSARR